VGTLAQNVTIDFSLKFDDELVKPKSPLYSWAPSNNSSSLKVLADSRIVPASATAATVVLPTHADALFHVIEEVNRADKLTVFINGDSNGNTLRPWRAISGAITALTVTNSDTVDVQYLRIYTVIPQGTVFERSGTVTLAGATTFIGLGDTPLAYTTGLYLKTTGTAVEFSKILRPIKSVATTYTIASTDHTVLADAVSAGFTITLPAAVDEDEYTINKIDSSANLVVVDGDAAETINGSGSYTLSVEHESVTVRALSGAWYIV
jgi:hypothetical protein